MKPTKRLFYALMVLLFLFLAGCAGKVSPGVPVACQQAERLTPECFDALYARYSPFLRAAVQTSVGIYLAEHPERGLSVYEVVSEVKARLEQDELTTLAKIEAIVRDRVDWAGLEPGVRLGVETLLVAVRAAVQALLDDLGVTAPEQVQLVAHDVVSWIYEATVVQCQACRPQALRRL